MTQPKAEVLAEFDKCPVCSLREELAEILGKPELKLGSGDNRLMRKLLDDEVKAGRRDKDEQGQACLQMLSASVMDPSKPPLFGAFIPTGTAPIDVCLDCGTVFAPIIVKDHIQLRPPQMPGMQDAPSGRIPGFGNPS